MTQGESKKPPNHSEERLSGATASFDYYRSRHASREPDLENLRYEDELRLISVSEGRRSLTVAPANDVLHAVPPRARNEAADKKYLWVVVADDVPFALESSAHAATLKRGYLAHTNLTGGAPAHAGGELWFADSTSVVINGGSGRYAPRSLDELVDIALAFKASGYRTAHMGFDQEVGRFARTLRGDPTWL